MLKVYKGTSIGWNWEALSKDKNALGLKIISIYKTWEMEKKVGDGDITRDEGKIVKAYKGLANDIHNLAIIIDMMKAIIEKSKQDNDLKEKDFLYLNVLFESYFSNLRSLFDFTSLIIRMALSDESIKRLPSRYEDSFSRILKFAKNTNNKGILSDEVVKAILDSEDTFNIIREIRDLIIHKGDEAIIYKEEDGLTFAIIKFTNEGPTNVVKNILGVESERYPVFDYLSELTNRTISYIEELALAIYVNLCKIKNEEIHLQLAALQGICMPNFIKFLGWEVEE